MLHRLILSFVLATPLLAQDGGQLYTLYCSACHAPDGKGAGNGTFPPLALSPFLADEPDRAIKIVLHGLHGPVNVLGKTYDLEMPPQGAAIVDDQIAAILTHVRSSWGNKAGPITTEQVKAIRTATADRAEHWTAAELLKLHPITEALPLTGLLSYAYNGTWKDIPDFTQLTPVATEEEPTGLISLPKIKKGKKAKTSPNGYLAMVWEGTLSVPANGEYDFLLGADDGGSLILDGKNLARITGIGPLKGRTQETTSALNAGPHKLRVEYYDIAGQKEIQVAWRKKGSPEWSYLTEASNPKAWPPIILAPENRAIIYRNFIDKTTPRSIGVGFPGGVNLAYSADHLAPELIWTGDFIDAGHHWTNRGQGNEPPAGKSVVNLTTKPVLPAEARFQGYKLDPAGNPTFATQLGGLQLLDSYTASAPATLIRVLKINGTDTGRTLTLVDGPPVKAVALDTYDIGENLTITTKSAMISGGKLVLPLVPGSSTEIRYAWK